jgi:hypothetical protein
MWRRAHARKRHEAGGQSEGFLDRDDAADIKANTSPTDFFPIEQMQLMKFDGEAWRLFGDVINGLVGH